MSSIIKTYKPIANGQTKFNIEDLSKEGVREIGLEKIARDLLRLSQGRLAEFQSMRAPEK